MSSAPTSMPRSHVITLLRILRSANEHYSQLAATFRASLRPTHHARKRAQALRLSVSIEAAGRLDQKQISTIPLPILEQVATPLAPACAIAAPIPKYASQVQLNKQNEAEIKRAGRPVLTCTIPAQPLVVNLSATYSTMSLAPASSLLAAHTGLQGRSNARYDVTSRWSATTIGSNDMENDNEIEIDSAKNGEIYSSDYDESMDLPNSADSISQLEILRPIPQTRPTLPTRAAAAMSNASHINKLPPRIDVRIDVACLSWPSNLSSIPRSGSISSSSSSDGPATPSTDEGLPKLMISVKRKSHVSDVDMGDDTGFEKRPKYGRKEWVSSARRTVQRTASVRRH